MDFQYAEQFGLDPQGIRKTVTVRTWLRWLLRENARCSRRAWEKAQQATDWAKELTNADRTAMQWSEDHNIDSS